MQRGKGPQEQHDQVLSALSTSSGSGCWCPPKPTMRFQRPSAWRHTTLPLVLFALSAYFTCSEAIDCAPPPINLRVGNVTLSTGNVRRGVEASVGTPPQTLAFMPGWSVPESARLRRLDANQANQGHQQHISLRDGWGLHHRLRLVHFSVHHLSRRRLRCSRIHVR
jgi:hypothetical protein